MIYFAEVQTDNGDSVLINVDHITRITPDYVYRNDFGAENSGSLRRDDTHVRIYLDQVVDGGVDYVIAVGSYENVRKRLATVVEVPSGTAP